MTTRRAVLFMCALFSILFINLAWAADTITGKVVSIADGDTITVLDSSKTQHKIRLYGIDCPESHQDFGQKAKEFTSGLVFGQNVEVKVMDTDRYGRSVGVVSIGSKTLNEELLKNGMAWYYGQYCKTSFCSQWSQYQEDAKNKKIGLWSMANPTPPWEFRRAGKTGSSTEATTQKTPQAGAYHGNTSSKVFHQSNCDAYSCKNCTDVFQNRADAVKAGYKPCGKCKP